MTGQQSNRDLRILVFGAGAIGAYVGGSLVLSGYYVVFLERSEIVPELRQRGLHLRLVDRQEHIASPMLAGSLKEALSLGPYDIAIFAMKSYDTQSAMTGLRLYSDSIPPILCLQNGVDNEPTLEAFLGKGRVIAGSVTSAIGRDTIGEVILERFRGIGIASGHPLSATLVRVMDKAGLNARLYPKAKDMKWSKLLTNLVANASSAILDISPTEIYAHPGLYRLELAQLRETLIVMHASGIHPVNLPATPVSLLAFMILRIPEWLSRPILARFIGGGRGSKMPSFYIDLHSGGGKSEVDYLNGAVVRNGKRLGIPTPANDFLNQTLQAITNGELEEDTYAKQPMKLIAAYSDFTTP